MQQQSDRDENKGSDSYQERNDMMASIAPTPIDPSGIVVVRNVDLADPDWISHSLIKHRELLNLLRPLVDENRVTHADGSDTGQESEGAAQQYSGNATVSTMSSASPVVASSTMEPAPNTSRKSASSAQFRPYQSEQWRQRFMELVEYKQQYGDCLVPTRWSVNPALALWVKRMRHQYRIKHSQKDSAKSTLSDEREAMLNEIGFVWKYRGTVWEDNYAELSEFYEKHGHSVIARNLPPGSSLLTWVKCQRRQYRLMREGKQSSMTDDRVARLERLDFVWEPRQQKDDGQGQKQQNSVDFFLPEDDDDDESALSFGSLSGDIDGDKKPAAK